MEYYVLVLRLIHIVGGIAWVGSVFMMNYFVGPTIATTQDAGQQFMSHLMTRTRFTAAMTGSAIFTVLAGFALMARDAGVGSAWIRSGPGIGFSIGAVFAIIGFVCGMLAGMTSRALGRLSGEVQGKPTAEQSAKLEILRKRLNIVNPLNVYSLLIAVIMMAVARYLVF